MERAVFDFLRTLRVSQQSISQLFDSKMQLIQGLLRGDCSLTPKLLYPAQRPIDPQSDRESETGRRPSQEPRMGDKSPERIQGSIELLRWMGVISLLSAPFDKKFGN